MNYRCLASGALAVLFFGTILHAQGISIPTVQQSFTTGMVGFTTNQTARINVLNMNRAITPVAGGTSSAAANCSVELAFYDNNNTLVKSTTVSGLAPGTATSFDLTRATVTSETTPRAEIRGVVTVNPSTAAASSVVLAYCNVFTTLEVFDSTTGSTISLTSDTRSTGVSLVTPAGTPAN